MHVHTYYAAYLGGGCDVPVIALLISTQLQQRHEEARLCTTAVTPGLPPGLALVKQTLGNAPRNCAGAKHLRTSLFGPREVWYNYI